MNFSVTIQYKKGQVKKNRILKINKKNEFNKFTIGKIYNLKKYQRLNINLNLHF